MREALPGQLEVGSDAPFLPAAPELLAAVVEGLEDAVVVSDQSGRFLVFNPAAEKLFGVRLDACATDEIAARLHLCVPGSPNLFPAERVPLVRALRGEASHNIEMAVRPAGQDVEFLISASATPLVLADGRVSAAMLVCRDITAARRAEAQLRRERDRAASIIDIVATLVIVLDRTGRVAGFNRACEVATGYSFEEIRGRLFWDLPLVSEDAEQLKLVFDKVRSGIFPSRHENHWKTKDGRRRLISWANTALAGRSGEVEYIIGTGMDITDRKRTEDELRQANDMLRAVIDTSPLAIVMMDLAGNVKSWNRAAEQIFGWRPNDVIGRPFPIVPENDEEFFRNNQERLRRGETISGVERQRRRKDGTTIDVALWNAPQRDAEGNVIGAISVIADMTDRRRLEEEFRQAQKMEAVGRLAGGVAHDFNNLLTVITGYTQMLLDGLEPDHPMRSYVEEIIRASESAAALTNQLLAFSRRQIVTPHVLDLNTLIAGMDKMLHPLIGEDIELVTVLDPAIPKVKVDEGQFQQVLMNLAVNARDAMPQGGTITVATEISVIEEPGRDGLAPGSYIVLSVSDTGKGMTEDVRRRIFEPFFTTKGRGKGTGLGLSTVYGIVKQAGGEVTVDSDIGWGTTFRVFLPAVGRAVAAGVEASGVAEKKKGNETVLLVEDEAGLRKLIREILTHHGYTVLAAADSAEALQLASRHPGPIHLFLTDIIMPGMSGRDLAKHVSNLRPQLKVLYMSGHTDHALLEGGSLAPGTSFLQKPFTPEVLLTKVREVLEAS